MGSLNAERDGFTVYDELVFHFNKLLVVIGSYIVFLHIYLEDRMSNYLRDNITIDGYIERERGAHHSLTSFLGCAKLQVGA